MKTKALIAIGLILLTSVSIAGASSLPPLNQKQVNENGEDGRIYGRVETQGHSMLVGVPDLKVACGTNLNNYEVKITDENGFFEFSDLTYDDTGTKYFVWILPGQSVIFPELKVVELNDENSEEDVYFYVLLWNLVRTNQHISLLI